MRKLCCAALLFLSFTTLYAADYRKTANVFLNDLEQTPGATFDVSLTKLCTSGYTKTVRNVPQAVKKQVCEAYGVTPEHCTGKQVEIDHLISLELGGSNDPGNLWPQPYEPKPGAREKDKLENWLHKQVCSGEMALVDAQKVIATDWYGAYLRMLQAITPPGRVSIMAEAATVPAETVAATAATSATTAPVGSGYNFAISLAYLQQLEAGKTIQPTITMRLGDHSKVHPLGSDCELHVAARPQSVAMGTPPDVVIEPPNVCMNPPASAGSGGTDWLAVFDSVRGTGCEVTGYPRIFTEHVSSGGGASNPDHVFEIHPATTITCGQQTLSFGNMLKVYSGMRAISPAAAASCIGNRELEVRYDDAGQQYVFREHGGTCGNFAVIQVASVVADSVRSIGGGHSAIMSASPDGNTYVTLKIYTLSPSAADQWLAGIPPTQAFANRVLLHGLFTYDYFAIERALHPQSQEWKKPSDWIPVNHPIAFVVFGQTDTAPWED